MKREPGLTSFVGAGPGDPDLLTVRGARAIADARLVIYPGSLIPRAFLDGVRPDAIIRDSSSLTLDETHELIREIALSGDPVARLCSGDPSLYGAVPEQIALLERDNLPWEIIPGVTAACAAAAAAGISFTIPELSQTLVLTRLPGRTPLPEGESLASLIAPCRSLAVYLSGAKASELREELTKKLPGDAPVLCAHRIGHKDSKLVWTTAEEVDKCVTDNGLEDQTVFLVVPWRDKKGALSRLYSKDFESRFRKV